MKEALDFKGDTFGVSFIVLFSMKNHN